MPHTQIHFGCGMQDQFYVMRTVSLSWPSAQAHSCQAMPIFVVEAMVHGYYVYQDVWNASIHEKLRTMIMCQSSINP